MKHIRLGVLLFECLGCFCLIGSGMFGCSGGDLTMGAPADANYKLRPRARILPKETMEQFVSGKDGRYTFTTTAPLIDKLKSGDVIVSTHRPNVFLRKIKSISRSGGFWVLDTEFASLSELIEEGDVKIRFTLHSPTKQQGLTSQTKKLENGLSVKRQGVSFYPTCSILGSKTAFSAFKPDFKASGGLKIDFPNSNINFKFTPDAEAKLTWNGIKFHFFVTGEPHFDFNTRLSTSGSLSLSKEVQMMECTARFELLPMPIVGNFSFEVRVGYEVKSQGTASVTVGVKNRGKIKAGAQYLGGNWSKVIEVTPGFTKVGPTYKTSASIEAKVFIKPVIQLKLYGAAGPSIDFQGALRWIRDFTPQKRWKLYRETQSNVNFDVRIFKKTLAQYTRQIYSSKKKIAGSPNCPKSCGDCNSCQDGKCKPALEGKSCTPANPCSSGVCQKGQCIQKARPDNTVCGKNKVCQKGKCITRGCSPACGSCKECVGGVCKPLPDGGSCDDDKNQCTRDVCQGGICKHPPVANGSSCGAGKICSSGNCITSNCNPKCGSCETCEKGKCKPKADGFPCEKDTNLCTLDICKQGKCSHPVVANGIRCGTGKVCQGGKCEAASCNPACSACEKCVQGKCQKLADLTACTSDNNDCTDDVCSSGVCTHNNRKDGISCGGGKVCRQGVCISPCGGVSCAPCTRCSGGSCVADSGADGRSCGGPLVCKSGKCIDPCNGVTCNSCQRCSGGACIADSTKQNLPCPGGKVCLSGNCVDVCAGKNCPECNKCSGGACVPDATQDNKSCSNGVCQQGTCKSQQCSGVSCNFCQTCANGKCVPDSSKEQKSCGSGTICRQGLCVSTSPCAGKKCPECEKCSNGNCVSDPAQNNQSCGVGKVCKNGVCDDPCKGKTCNLCEQCSNGSCVPDSSQNGKSCGTNSICVSGQCQAKCGNCRVSCISGNCCGDAGQPCCPNSVCGSQLVCKKAGRCETVSTLIDQTYRFVSLCTSAHWQSVGNTCYPSSSGATVGCSCASSKFIKNGGCSVSTCWKREITFRTYRQDPGYGSFFRIHHCFEQGANRYNKTGCTTYGDPKYLGWIASSPVGFWKTPVYLCEWVASGVKEHLFVVGESECTKAGGTIVLHSGSKIFGYAMP